MARSTSAPARKARKNKLFSKSKGYFQARNNRLRQAHQAVMKAESYAYRGRKERKRQFRRLWIVRINASMASSSRKSSWTEKSCPGSPSVTRRPLASW